MCSGFWCLYFILVNTAIFVEIHVVLTVLQSVEHIESDNNNFLIINDYYKSRAINDNKNQSKSENLG